MSERIQFKIAVLTFRVVRGAASSYLVPSVIQLSGPTRLSVPISSQTFNSSSSPVGPSLQLPVHLEQSVAPRHIDPSLQTFWKILFGFYHSYRTSHSFNFSA